MPSPWLTGSFMDPTRDDPSAADYPLDHAIWGGFSQRPGNEVAAEEATDDAERATGGHWQRWLTDDELDYAAAEGEAWGDNDE